MDHIIQQHDEHNKAKRKQKDWRTNAYGRLQEAEETIRVAAVSHMGGELISAVAVTANIPGSSQIGFTNDTPPVSLRGSLRPTKLTDHDGEEDPWLKDEMRVKAENEGKRIKLDEEHLQIEREQASKREEAERKRSGW